HDQGRRIDGIKDAKSLANYRDRLVRELAKELAAAPAHCHTLLLSNEHCSAGVLLRDEGAQGRALLRLWSGSYSVGVDLRPQHSLAASVSSMLLKGGQYDPRMLVNGALPGKRHPPREYVPYFDYHALLTRWASVFGKENVQPRLWHELPNRNVIDD